MMKTINAVKIGNTINVSLNGKLHKKNCGSADIADKLFGIVLEAKKNPSEENIKTILGFLNEKTRIAMECGLETDPETGQVFMAGFNTPVPMDIVELVQEYHEKKYPVDAIVNFWKLLMLNPDERVREDLFEFIRLHDFVITDNGYMVVYKAVNYKAHANDDLAEFVTNQYLHVRKHWKCSARKYEVYRMEGELHITKKETLADWDLEEKGVEHVGNLDDLFRSVDKIIEDSEDVTTYTDMHTNTMEIQLGKPVVMPRTECDSDPRNECSYGLHVGATSYVESFGRYGKAVLVCYVNPANVVAVPNYDRSKMRVTEYFPFALATYEDGKIDIIDEPFFESDYMDIEASELEEMVGKVLNEQTPIESAYNALEETRDLDELQKIIEARLVDIEKK